MYIDKETIYSKHFSIIFTTVRSIIMGVSKVSYRPKTANFSPNTRHFSKNMQLQKKSPTSFTKVKGDPTKFKKND